MGLRAKIGKHQWGQGAERIAVAQPHMPIDGAAGKIHRPRSLDGLQRGGWAQVYDLRAAAPGGAVRRIRLQMHHKNGVQIVGEQRQKRGVIRVGRRIGAGVDAAVCIGFAAQ